MSGSLISVIADSLISYQMLKFNVVSGNTCYSVPGCFIKNGYILYYEGLLIQYVPVPHSVNTYLPVKHLVLPTAS